MSRLAITITILEERRARTQGTTKIAPKTEPTPMELNRIPQPAAESFSSFRPTTGNNAGIRAIKKANKTFRASMTCMPGAYRTYRMAVEKDSKKFSNGSFDGRSFRFHCKIASMTIRKQIELRVNTQFAPMSGSSIPPIAGPRIPEILSCKPPSVAAEGSSSSDTSSGTIAVQAGALKANPIPIRKTQKRIMYGLRIPKEPKIASSPAATASQRFMIQSNLRLSTMSAKAPAGKVKRKNGKDATVDINDRNTADALSLYITQVAAQS